MKSTKFLAVLAGAAMFTACTQEELFEVNNAPQQMEEIVGTKLVGTDVSLNVSMGEASSRWAGGEATWEKEDLVGLGWIVKKNPYTDQVGENGIPLTPDQNKLFANHMYNYDENTELWTTKGNIYEGWYAAYYPWSYSYKVEQKSFLVNPDQTTANQAEHYSKRLFISNRQFVSAGSVNTDNTLETQFEMFAAVKAIRVKATSAEGSSFANNEVMKTKKIEYITFNTGDETKKIFASNVKFNPQNLAAWNEELTTAENKANFYANLYETKKPVLVPETYTSTLTTNFVKNGRQAVSDEKIRLMAYAVPAQAELDVEEVSIKIGIEGGAYFLIDKNDESEKNQEALSAFVAAYAENGGMTKMTPADGVTRGMDLEVELHDDIFFTDFSKIANIDDWKNAVDMVDILGREEESFKIVGKIDFSEGIYMPKNGCKLTVERGHIADESSSATLENYYFNITGNLTGWPENLDTKQIKVVIDGATVEDAHQISARKIVNKGTLNVPDNGVLTSASQTLATSYILNDEGGVINLNYKSKVSRVDNTSGRINVIYGSYVEPLQGKAGEIAYIVSEEDAETPSRIKDVVASTGQSNYANVNILVFNQNKIATFDFTKTTSGKPGDNPYYDNHEDGTEAVLALEGVSLEINGVDVKSSSEIQTVTVANVTMNGGSLTNVNIKGAFTATGDVQVAAPSIEGNVTVTGTTEAQIAVSGEIKGNVTATNATVSAKTITGAVVAEDAEITAETITGDVTLKGESTINGAEITGNVTVEEGTATLNDVTINGTLTIMKGAKVLANSENTMYMTAIVNDGGELVSNNDIKVTDITLQNKSVTTLGEDWENTIWYTGEYVHNNSSVNGWVKKCPTTSEELQAALSGKVEGATVYLAESVDYVVTAGELKDVTIEGAENAVVIFKTDANTKIENVTLKKVNFEYTGEVADCGVVIDANAQIENLVLENCEFVGNDTKAGRGLSGYNNNANIVIKNCTFKDLGYPIYAWGGYESLTIEDCTFNDIKSWAIMPQSGFDGDLTVTGCSFINCLGGGLVKAGTLTAGHTFTFTDNTITNCTIAGDHNWFQFNVSAGKSVISGNTKDDQVWIPSLADGLK